MNLKPLKSQKLLLHHQKKKLLTSLLNQANQVNKAKQNHHQSLPMTHGSPLMIFLENTGTCFQEMCAWIDVQMLRSGANSQNVLKEFCSRFTGQLRDWYDSLGQYRQMSFCQLPIAHAISHLYEQFLGEPGTAAELARREYHQMKCCSLLMKDLEFHYKRMSQLYYKLGGYNDPSLRHVFVASLPKELQPELQRQVNAHKLDIGQLPLGKIYQFAVACLDKMCEQKEFFSELIKRKEPFKSACKKPYLAIKCPSEKTCECKPKKKAYFSTLP